MDGGVAETGIYENDFPHWMRRLELSLDAAEGVFEFTRESERDSISAIMSKNLEFGSRLVARLFNPHEEENHVQRVYMEGKLRLI